MRFGPTCLGRDRRLPNDAPPIHFPWRRLLLPAVRRPPRGACIAFATRGNSAGAVVLRLCPRRRTVPADFFDVRMWASNELMAKP